MDSRQSQSAEASHLSPGPSTSTASLAVDKDFSLSPSGKTIQSSLKRLNDYVQKYLDQLFEHQSLERSRLVASFTEKEQNYQRQISTLNVARTDVIGLLARERIINGDLCQRLDVAANSMARLCNVIADTNLVSARRDRGPHGIKQEDDLQESVNISHITMCPDAAISSLLSQIETLVIEINAQNGASLPSPPDSSPCHSTIKALDKAANSLLAAQRSFTLLLEDFKSLDAARANTERRNVSLQENFALIQKELERTRSENQRISQELAAAQIERKNHICRPSASVCLTPAIRGDFPISLPSPPLEKRDLPTPNDVLQDTCEINQKENQTPAEWVIPKHRTTPPPTPTGKPGPSSTSTSINGEQRKIFPDEVVTPVDAEAKSTSSAAQNESLESSVTRDKQQTAGLSIPSPVQGVKRTSSSVYDCQDISNVSRTLAPAKSLTSDMPNNHRPNKKRRINVASRRSLKNKLTKETPANSAHASTSTACFPSASSSKRTVVQLPKTKASDLKSLKFNKVSQSNVSPSAPPSVTSSKSNAPVKSDMLFMRPLDLAKKTPQERAALRKAK